MSNLDTTMKNGWEVMGPGGRGYFTDSELMTQSLAAWDHSYGRIHDPTDHAAAQEALKRAVIEDQRQAVGRYSYNEFGAGDYGQWMWQARYADNAYTKLVTSHKYAAALMATSAGSIAADIEVPWTAFLVVVPSGLLTVGDRNFTRIGVDLGGGTDVPKLFVYEPGYGSIFRIVAPNAEALLLADPIELSCDDDRQAALNSDDAVILCGHMTGFESLVEGKIIKLSQRLVAGLLVTMAHTNNFRLKEGSGSPRSLRNGPPRHRIAFVGRPISVDCRPAIRRFLEGSSHAPPSVQTLVRGHYKRQVIGMGRTGRKVIWVEPYWRGPEDAPILSRPRSVGPIESQSTTSAVSNAEKEVPI